MKALLTITISAIIIYCSTAIYLTSYNKPYNNTDNTINNKRSGLSLYTDNLTGCQYLKAGFIGGITPRLNYNNQHVGCK